MQIRGAVSTVGSDWEAYRHSRNMLILAWIGGLPGAVVLFVVMAILHLPEIVAEMVGLSYFGFLVVTITVHGCRMNHWRCPRCGALFFRSRNAHFYVRRCPECGLRKWASAGADHPEQSAPAGRASAPAPYDARTTSTAQWATRLGGFLALVFGAALVQTSIEPFRPWPPLANQLPDLNELRYTMVAVVCASMLLCWGGREMARGMGGGRWVVVLGYAGLLVFCPVYAVHSYLLFRPSADDFLAHRGAAWHVIKEVWTWVALITCLAAELALLYALRDVVRANHDTERSSRSGARN